MVLRLLSRSILVQELKGIVLSILGWLVEMRQPFLFFILILEQLTHSDSLWRILKLGALSDGCLRRKQIGFSI